MARRLNLGVGLKPMPDAINVDRLASAAADEVWDLDQYPWPWPNDFATEVHCTHLFEHIEDPLSFMAEVHRVLEPGGTFHVEVPHYQNRNAFTDPTHKRYCTEDTFRYWVPGNWLSDLAGEMYSRGCWFDELSNDVVSGDLRVVMRKR